MTLSTTCCGAAGGCLHGHGHAQDMLVVVMMVVADGLNELLLHSIQTAFADLLISPPSSAAGVLPLSTLDDPTPCMKNNESNGIHEMKTQQNKSFCLR